MQNKSNFKGDPLVSIGLTLYDRAHYLREVLDSWLGQTYENFELIISDDASPNPEVQKICEEYVAKDRRVRFFRQKKNLNIPASFKFVFGEARGKYFKWAEDDDLYDPHFLEDCVSVLEKNPELTMVFADMVDIDDNKKQFGHPDPKKYITTSRNTYDRLKEFILLPFGEGKVWLVLGLWKKEAVQNDPLFGYWAKDDEKPSYWWRDVFFTFRGLTRGPFGFVPQTRFFRRLRQPDERIPRPFVSRVAVSLYNRFKNVFGSPYSGYVARCIREASGLTDAEKLKLTLLNYFVMVKYLLARKT
ncbi:MAG: glycosyltransferase [bacterium]|nr:glycosyltransferase [bacterium]